MSTKVKSHQVELDGSFEGVLSTETTLDEALTTIDSLSKDDISGLENIDNTSDADKPISDATQTELNNLSDSLGDKEDISNKGVANGYASLDSNGTVPSSQLPSYVDDVLEYSDLENFPTTGESGKIYIDASTSKTYRWSGTQYVVMADTGVTSIDGQGGDITLKTINGTDLKGSGDIQIDGLVTSVNGETGDVIIEAGGGGDVSLSGTNLITTDSSTSGDNNVLLGYQSGTSITGNSNIGVGAYTLDINSSGNNNVAIGQQTLGKNITGSYNVGVGVSSLFNNTASNNTAVGYQSSYSNTSGSFNVSLGANSSRDNIIGGFNTAIGYSSLRENTANNNTAVGYDSLLLNTTGSSNTALGCKAGYSNINGHSNISIGYQSSYSNTSGRDNVSVGTLSFEKNTTGSNNTAIGTQSLRNNTASSNTAVGFFSSYSNTSASNNTSVGYESSFNNTTGSNNVSLGYRSLRSNSTGPNNTAIGYQSQYNSTNGILGNNTSLGADSLYTATGFNNTAVGYGALNNNSSYSNSTGIGAESSVTGSNQVQLGNSSTTTYAYGAVQDRSDRRDKADITDTDLGLEFINKVRPVKFKWDFREDYKDTIKEEIEETIEKEIHKYEIKTKTEKYIEDNQIKTKEVEYKEYLYETVEKEIQFIDTDEEGNDFINTRIETEEVPVMETITETVKKTIDKVVKTEKDGSKKRSRFHYGVIAQELQEVSNELGIDFGGLQDHSLNGGEDVMSVGYEEFISPLIKAIQELSKQVEELKNK